MQKEGEVPVRLNRYLASCGLGSRRSCEKLILAGEIYVNAEICRDLSRKIGKSDAVFHGDTLLVPRKESIVLLNKPKGYICSRDDEQGRKTIYALLPRELQHLHHVGRLDRESEGLILLTNSGELTHRLLHPKNKIQKEYVVMLKTPFDARLRRKLLEGMRTKEGWARVASVKNLSKKKLLVTLEQGLKRQIRLMFDLLGYEVERLIRVRIGHLVMGELGQGKWRRVKESERAPFLK